MKTKDGLVLECASNFWKFFSILEMLNKVATTQESIVQDIKGVRQDIDSLNRRLSAMGSPRHRAGAFSSTSQENGMLLSTHSWASILVALILYSLIQWLFEKIHS